VTLSSVSRSLYNLLIQAIKEAEAMNGYPKCSVQYILERNLDILIIVVGLAVSSLSPTMISHLRI
jgi:hypothetical protein